MKPVICLVLCAIGTICSLRAQELGDLRWQYRIVLLMDPYDNPLCDQQLNTLRQHTAQLQERDLLLFVFDGQGLMDERGKKSPIGVKEVPHPSFEGVILIGKDGGVKLRKPFLVSPEELFKRIDSMPMRKAELRDGKR